MNHGDIVTAESFIIGLAPFLAKGAVSALGQALMNSVLKTGWKALGLRKPEQIDGLSSAIAAGIARATWDALHDEHDSDPGDEHWALYETDEWRSAFNERLLLPLATTHAWTTYTQTLINVDERETADLLKALMRTAGIDMPKVSRALSLEVDGFLHWLGPSLIIEIRNQAAHDAETFVDLLAALRSDFPQSIEISPGQLRRTVRSYLNAVLINCDYRLKNPYAPNDISQQPFDQTAHLRVEVRKDVAESSTSDQKYDPLSVRTLNNKTQIISWEKLESQNTNLLILADPGLGKTRLLYLHAENLAHAALGKLKVHKNVNDLNLPIIIRCDSLHATLHKSLEQACASVLLGEFGVVENKSAKFQRWLIEHLESASNTYLLDALDEIPSTIASLPLGHMLQNWTARSAPGRVIIASRITGYRPPEGLTNFSEAELQPFTPEEVHNYVAACGMDQNHRAEIFDRLKTASFMGLARIPLLLGFICALANQQDSVPLNRHELYEQMIELLLDDRHHLRERPTSTTRKTLTRKAKNQLRQTLANIALHFADKPEGWVDRMPAKELTRIFSAVEQEIPDDTEELATESGILITAGVSTLSNSPPYFFLHRTFSEYLVAQALSVNASEWKNAIDVHLWFEEDWDQVFPLLGSAMDDPFEFLEYLLYLPSDPLHRSLHMVARVAEEITGHISAQTQSLIDVASTRLLQLLEIGELEAARSLQRIASHLSGTTLTRLINLLKHADRVFRLSAVQILSRSDKEIATKSILDVLPNEPDLQVKSSAIRALTARSGELITEVLVDILYNSPHGRLRLAAASAMGGRNSENAIYALQAVACARNENSILVRIALDSLAACESPLATNALHKIAFGLYSSRQAALDVLNKSSSAAVTAAMIVTLKSSRSNDIRADVLTALNQRRSHEVTDTLIALVLTETEPSNLRKSAIKALSKRNDAKIVGALTSIAGTFSGDPTVREQAIESLSSRNESEAAATLRAVALDDREPPVMRLSAVEALSHHVGDRAAEALVSILADSHHPLIRRTAAAAMADRESQVVTDALLSIVLASTEDTQLRQIAARIISNTDRNRAPMSLLLTVINHRSHPRLQRMSAEALTLGDHEHIISAQVGILNDSDDTAVRCMAAESLAGDDISSATDALLSVVSSETTDFSLREVAIGALANHGGAHVSEALMSIITNEDDLMLTRAALRALTARGPDGDIDAEIAAFLTGPHDSGKTCHVAQGLTEFQGACVTKTFVTLLLTRNENPKLRQSAAEALSKRGGENVTKALVSVLLNRSEDAMLRQMTALALADRDGTFTANALLGVLADKTDSARRMALSALAGFAGEQVTQAMLNCALSPDEADTFRWAAIRLLANRAGDRDADALYTIACTQARGTYEREMALTALSNRRWQLPTHTLFSMLLRSNPWQQWSSNDGFDSRSLTSAIARKPIREINTELEILNALDTGIQLEKLIPQLRDIMWAMKFRDRQERQQTLELLGTLTERVDLA